LIHSGAKWKLVCDGIIDLRPAETNASLEAASLALVQIYQIRKNVLHLVYLSVSDPSVSDAEYQKYNSATSPDRIVVSEDPFIADLQTMAGTMSNKETVNILNQAITKINELSEHIYIDRELVAMEIIDKSSVGKSSRPNFFLWGNSHTMDKALAIRKVSLTYIKLSSAS
jgi:hypothetical protein